jgi:hypothetical protein
MGVAAGQNLVGLGSGTAVSFVKVVGRMTTRAAYEQLRRNKLEAMP